MKKFLYFILLFPAFLWSQNDSIYNDDPAQYMPLGMQHAQYHYYADTGLAKIDKRRINPPFWWTGMKNPNLQILIYDLKIKDYKVSLENASGILLQKVIRVPNPNYLFINVEITNKAKPGWFDIILTKKDVRIKYRYELKQRDNDTERGLTNADFIYQIMPDRFANGDYSNDSYPDMMQTGINRGKMYFRHGGDIQGIIDHLDYISNLGATAIWATPLLENDQPYASYHGYAITDFYNIDKRFGTNKLYKKYVSIAHQHGLKIVMDIVLNHCGNENWLMKDIPSANWIHQWPEFTKSNFRSSIVSDPYASDFDKNKLSEGWFDYSMPDLNQSDTLVATYLIQNNIWWVEYTDLDAFRIDTWFFPDQDFLSQWVNAMQAEFPKLTLFGETWVQNESVQAYFTKNNKSGNVKSFNLPSVTDFQLNFAIEEALTKSQSWTKGVARLYYTLAQDFLYDNAYNNVIFLDNHDKSRIFETVGKNKSKLKSAIGLLMTLRGIPCMYYGTELMFEGDANPDGKVRQDFPGGWKEDKIDKFNAKGRTNEEMEIYDFVKTLGNYRKTNPVLHTGKFKHFVPENGIYVYFRYNDNKTIMVILNTGNNKQNVDITKYKEMLSGHSKAKKIISGKTLDLNNLKIDKNSILILEIL